MSNYPKMFFLEEKEFLRVDFTVVNRPCSFNNTCEQVLYQERNQLEKVKNLGLPFSQLMKECAMTSCKEGNYTNAIQQFEKSILWNPADVSAHIEYIEFLLYIKDYKRFEEVAKEAFRYVYKKTEMVALYNEIRLYIMDYLGIAAFALSEERINEILIHSGYEIYTPGEISATLVHHASFCKKDRKRSLECYKAAFEIAPDNKTAEILRKLEE